MIARDLTGQTDADRPSRGQHGPLRFRHVLRLSRDELDSARRAARVAAARVQDVDAGVFLDRPDEPLPRRNFDRPVSFNCQLRHTASTSPRRYAYRFLIVGIRYSLNARWKS